MSLFLDTAVLHGFFNSRDKRHADAVGLVEAALEGRYGRVVTSTFVLDEAVTLAGVRRQPHSVVEDLLGVVGLNPDAGVRPFVSLVDVTMEDVVACLPLQKRHWDRGLSFTDCTNLHVMEREGIAAIATFDSGFDGLVAVIDRA